jgi:hypothetical protein
MKDVIGTNIQLTIDCSTPECDLEELATRTEQLREELIEAEVEVVTAGPGPAVPQGARAVDPIAIGTLLVTLAASRGVLVTLLQTLQTWIQRHDKNSITVEGKGGMKIRITGRMSVTKDRLIEAWISRQLKS